MSLQQSVYGSGSSAFVNRGLGVLTFSSAIDVTAGITTDPQVGGIIFGAVSLPGPYVLNVMNLYARGAIGVVTYPVFNAFTDTQGHTFFPVATLNWYNGSFAYTLQQIYFIQSAAEALAGDTFHVTMSMTGAAGLFCIESLIVGGCNSTVTLDSAGTGTPSIGASGSSYTETLMVADKKDLSLFTDIQFDNGTSQTASGYTNYFNNNAGSSFIPGMMYQESPGNLSVTPTTSAFSPSPTQVAYILSGFTRY